MRAGFFSCTEVSTATRTHDKPDPYLAPVALAGCADRLARRPRGAGSPGRWTAPVLLPPQLIESDELDGGRGMSLSSQEFRPAVKVAAATDRQRLADLSSRI